MAGVIPIGAAGHLARCLSVLALLGVVLVLMFAPAVVAMISALDGHLMDQAGGWFRGQIRLIPFVVVLGRLGSTLVLAGIVSSSREDQ